MALEETNSPNTKNISANCFVFFFYKVGFENRKVPPKLLTHLSVCLCATSDNYLYKYSTFYILLSLDPHGLLKKKREKKWILFRNKCVTGLVEYRGAIRGRSWWRCGGVTLVGSFQGCTLKESSSSECMLLRERSSGSLRRSLVNVVADSSPWFCITRFRSTRISLSCRASTEFRSWIPERSGSEQRGEKQGFICVFF